MAKNNKIQIIDNEYVYKDYRISSGFQLGSLTFLGFLNDIGVSKQIKVRCKCGKVMDTRFNDFIRSRSSTCENCSHFDIIGQTYGFLKVKDFFGYNDNHRLVFKCICVCGHEVLAIRDDLKSKSTVSCGCHRIRSAEHIEYTKYKRNAKSRKLSFELTTDEFNSLINNNCFYCGTAPSRKISNHAKAEHLQRKAIVNGIDRLDSSLGYIKTNCVSCCFECNSAKMDLTVKEFMDMIRRIYHFSAKDYL